MPSDPGPPRPVLHFTPREGWINDPNGLFHLDGVWHLYYQHNPYDVRWGGIHWGHATSRDLVRWDLHDPALIPTALGVAASGCAVVDRDGRSGFAGLSDGALAPVIAVFTRLPDDGPQVQSLAVSGDGGFTFEESPRPFLVDESERDFRDPNVRWVPAMRSFVMVLAVGDEVRVYRSPNLRQWVQLCAFGPGFGAHGGIWECPDLFPLPDPDDGREHWVLLVSVNDGGPNGGSAMQYFVGRLGDDGFRPHGDDPSPRWLDYGPDCYAGVTFSDAPEERRVMIAWMSNWRYADAVPDSGYRGAMTLPRELALARTDGRLEVVQRVPAEVVRRRGRRTEVRARVERSASLLETTGVDDIELRLDIPGGDEVRLVGRTDARGAVVLRVDRARERLTVDRSGMVPASSLLADEVHLPLLFERDRLDLQLVVDRTSLEIFASGGRRAATVQLLPDGPIVAWRIEVASTVDVRASHWPLGER